MSSTKKNKDKISERIKEEQELKNYKKYLDDSFEYAEPLVKSWICSYTSKPHKELFDDPPNKPVAPMIITHPPGIYKDDKDRLHCYKCTLFFCRDKYDLELTPEKYGNDHRDIARSIGLLLNSFQLVYTQVIKTMDPEHLQLFPELKTVIFMPNPKYSYLEPVYRHQYEIDLMQARMKLRAILQEKKKKSSKRTQKEIDDKTEKFMNQINTFNLKLKNPDIQKEIKELNEKFIKQENIKNIGVRIQRIKKTIVENQMKQYYKSKEKYENNKNSKDSDKYNFPDFNKNSTPDKSKAREFTMSKNENNDSHNENTRDFSSTKKDMPLFQDSGESEEIKKIEKDFMNMINNISDSDESSDSEEEYIYS